MISDENHPHMIAAQQELMRRINLLVLRRGIACDRGFMDDLKSLCYDHRARSRQQGLDWPNLTALVVPRLGQIAVYRADLDEAGIRGAVLQFARQQPSVTGQELALAIALAFPQMKGRVFDLSDAGLDIGARQARRDQLRLAETAGSA